MNEHLDYYKSKELNALLTEEINEEALQSQFLSLDEWLGLLT